MITTLHLGLSYRCNLACSHCYVHKKKDVLSTEDYFRFISEMNDNGLLVVMYTYGEPLLADKLPEVAGFVDSLGVSQTVLTNGWYINEDKIDELSLCHVNSYNVSLDSMIPEKHDKVRGCKGAYEHAVRAIKMLKNKGKNVGLGVTVTDQNADELFNFVDFAVKEEIDRISFLAQRVNGVIRSPLSSAYMQMFNDAIMGRSPVKNIFFHDPRLLRYIENLYSGNAVDLMTFERWSQMNSCHIGKSVSLEPDGNVYSCNLCSKELICNIADLSKCLSLSEKVESINERFICCPLLSKKSN